MHACFFLIVYNHPSSSSLFSPSYADIWTSSDLYSWSNPTASVAYGGRYGHAVTVFNNVMIVAGGLDSNGNYLNDV